MSVKQLEIVYVTTNHPCGKKVEGVVVPTNNSTQTIDQVQKLVAADIAKQRPSEIHYQVLLFTLRGFPLSGNKTSNAITLEKAGLASGKIYVQALLHAPGPEKFTATAAQLAATDPDEGDVQIFVKDNRTQPICCRPKYDTIEKLMLKIQKKTGYKVSEQLLSIRGKPVSYNSRVAKLTLQVFGVMAGTTIFLSARMVDLHEPCGRQKLFYAPAIPMLVPQTKAGLAAFYASLYTLTSHLPSDKQEKLLACVRSVSGDAALVLALRMLFDLRTPNIPLRKALVEGLYRVFRAIIPPSMGTGVDTTDNAIFEHSAVCWMALLDKSKDCSSESAKWDDEVSLTCAITFGRLVDPVKTPKWWKRRPNTVVSRRSVLDEIKKANNASASTTDRMLTEDDLEPALLHQALLAAFPSTNSCMLWTPEDWYKDCQLDRAFPFFVKDFPLKRRADSAAPTVSLADLAVRSEADFRLLKEKTCQYSYLHVHPPLSLKTKPRAPVMTIDPDTQLVSVYVNRSKGDPANSCRLFRVLTGRECTFDIDSMVSSVAKHNQTKVGTVTRPPFEAIVVLLDISGSMTLPGFEMPHELMPGRAPGDVRAQDRVAFTKEQAQKLGSASASSGGMSAKIIEQLNGVVKQVSSSGICTCDFNFGNTLRVWAKDLVVLSKSTVQLNRIDTVKQLFHAYANRSMAYNLPHVVGLTLFGSKVKVACPLTEAYESFKEHVDGADAEGVTSLFDALKSGSDQLEEFVTKCDKIPPEGCLRRIICLTDGEDTTSKTKAHTITKELQQRGVVVDAVMINSDMEDMALRAISVATGGCCFNPTDITTGLRLFEMETVLSLRERKRADKIAVVYTEAQLKLHEGGRNDDGEPGFNLQPPRKVPKTLEQKATGIATTLHRASMRPPRKGAPVSRRIKRLLREVQSYSKNPHPAIEVWPCEEDVSFWHVLLKGPEGTPYAGGVFVLWVSFPESYPKKSPEVRFRTPIHHCNINNTGKVCHSIFDHNWASDMSMRQVFDCTYGLLLAPEPDDPLDSVLAAQFYENRGAYDKAARDMTRKHASKPIDKCREQLTGGDMPESGSSLKESRAAFDKIDHPKHLVCPLTLELFEDPVSTIHGHSYERKAIIAALARKQVDPMTRAPLTPQQIFPNIAIRHAVEEYRKAMAAAKPWWQSS